MDMDMCIWNLEVKAEFSVIDLCSYIVYWFFGVRSLLHAWPEIRFGWACPLRWKFATWFHSEPFALVLDQNHEHYRFRFTVAVSYSLQCKSAMYRLLV